MKTSCLRGSVSIDLVVLYPQQLCKIYDIMIVLQKIFYNVTLVNLAGAAIKMESVRTRFSTLSVNHVLFVCLCAVVVYLFRAGDTYYLKPVWRKRVESHQFANGEYPTEKDQLPPPIVTDLESDGVNEVVLITNDMKLTILALPDSDPQNEAILPHVIVKHKVTLPLVDARPVIMKTGFTVPLQSMVQMRSQVSE